MRLIKEEDSDVYLDVAEIVKMVKTEAEVNKERAVIKEVSEKLKGRVGDSVEEYQRPMPSRAAVIKIVRMANTLMFPSYYCPQTGRYNSIKILRKLIRLLKEQISVGLGEEKNSKRGHELALEVISEIPEIRRKLLDDVTAIYEGDPAASSRAEIILTYPGFWAISVYRLAHELYIKNIPLIPRIMSEFAHEKTGIDIHPGAKIGEYFCIDHGTGIVIGESTEIGERVKIYQGVTLGARSIPHGDDGIACRGVKRHPKIGDRCTVYANATILGGDTVIGSGSIIGANVWLTHSVPENSKIYYSSSEN